MKCLGLVLNKTTSKATIDKHLDVIFNSVNHAIQAEREVDNFLILSKIYKFAKYIQIKKGMRH